MKIRTFGNFIRDALLNIKRNSWMSIASVSSVIAVLVLMGLVLIFMMNIQHVADTVENTIELKAFLDVDIEEEQIESIQTQLDSNEKIKGITFETKEDALKNFSEQIGERQDLMKGLEENNPMQNSYIISLNNPADAKEVSEYMGKIEGVEEVKYGEEIVDKLLQSTYFIQMFTIILTLILAGVSIFIISNTIKITVFSRKREINIMKYVGATNWFVRWPFLIEGAVLGFVGSLFAVLILGYGYYYFTGMTQSTALSFISGTLISAGDMMSMVTGYFIITGLVLGTFGSLISIRKFLKV